MNMNELYKELFNKNVGYVKTGAETEYISDTEIKIPTEAANVLLGVVLGLLATGILSGHRFGVSHAVTGGTLGGLAGLFGSELYKEKIAPTLKEILGL